MRVVLEIERSNYPMIFKRADSRNLLQTKSHLHGMTKDTWYTWKNVCFGGHHVVERILLLYNGVMVDEEEEED